MTSALLLLATLTGCGTVNVPDPVTKKLTGADDFERQLEFWHTLADQPVACNDEAFHALLLYFDGADASTDYAQRVEALKSKKMLPPNFNRPADEAVERGTVAVAIVRGLNIKGGWAMSVFGGQNERYASRELQYMNLYPPGSPQQLFTGQELIGIIGRIEDYQRGNPTDDAPASVLPSEAEADPEAAKAAIREQPSPAGE